MEEKISKGETKNIMLFRENWMIYVKIIRNCQKKKDILQGVSDRYDRVVRVLGIETVDTAVQQDIQNEKVLEEKRRMEQMPKGNIHERLAWGMKKKRDGESAA